MLKFVIKILSLTLVNLLVLSSPIATSLHAGEDLTIQVDNTELLTDETLPPLFGDDIDHELSYWKEFARMMAILGAILGFVLLIAWLLRGFLNNRIKQVNQHNVIKVLERRNLSQKSMMYLIEVYNKQFLIGDSAAGGVEFLMECVPNGEQPLPEKIETLPKNSKFSFMEILQKKLSDKKPKFTPSKK